MNLKVARFLFIFGRVTAVLLTILDAVAIVMMTNLGMDIRVMLLNLALGIGSFYICTHGLETVDERIKEENGKH